MKTPVRYIIPAIAAAASLCAPDFGGAMAGPSACHAIPAQVREYLSREGGWTLVTVADLVRDDAGFWTSDRPDECPGLARADIDGSGRPAYALALISGSGAARREKLVALRQVDGLWRATTLVEPYKTGAPAVVMRAKAGVVREWESKKPVVLSHESFDYVQYEASSRQFYWAGDGFKSVVTSD